MKPQANDPMRVIFRLGLTLMIVGNSLALAQEPLRLEAFVQPSKAASLTISPDGKHIAGVGIRQNMGQSNSVFVTDLDTYKTSIAAGWKSDSRFIGGAKPADVHWINNELLAVEYNTEDTYVFDLNGKELFYLGERFIRRLGETGASADWVLVLRNIKDHDIEAVNIRSRERKKFRINLPGKPIHWVFDGDGVLRAVTMEDTKLFAEKTRWSNWYRASEQAAWQLLDEGSVTDDHWIPLSVLPESDMLAVYSRHGRDTYAVFRYDTLRKQPVDLMAGHPAEDILQVTGLDQPYFEKVITAGLRPQITWFDSRWSQLQKSVDAALPDHVNLLQGDKNGRVLVFSYSDIDPGRWLVLDTKAGTLKQVSQLNPYIEPTQMRPMESLSYAARDGLTIPAYLTRPISKTEGPAPMVVLIHGGPHVRDQWHWNAEVQALASRGYVVFQPQFRGSTGFGKRFEQAGYQQWGRAMQEDIEDGVRHLIESKVADPNRICISGASYGGYAALWGVIKTPELYKCGISFAGVSDLNDFLTTTFLDDSTAVSREQRRAFIGDPDKSRATLDALSPLKQVSKIQTPLLIAYGEDDRRVLPSHSKDLIRALQVQGKPVEAMAFDRAGHGFRYVVDEFRYFSATLAFLEKYIGPSRASPAQPAASGVDSR